MLKLDDTINSILFDCQCAILLLDITNKQSLAQLEKLFDVIPFSEFSYLKLILVENKIDEKREISEEQINSFIEKNEIKDNMKISIKENTGIEELANKIKEYVNKKENDIPINFSSQNLNEYKNEFKELNSYKNLKTANFIFLGNSNVGKTSLYLRLNKNFYNNKFLSTIGIDRSFKTYKVMHDNRINTSVSTSCGRLFDAAAAILGIRYEQSFEGEAATALEFKAMEYERDKDIGTMDLIDGDVIATDRIIRYLTEEKLKGTDIRKLAYAFHYMLAKGVAQMAMAKSDGIKTAALSGGCYQNKLLTRLTEQELKENGYKIR